MTKADETRANASNAQVDTVFQSQHVEEALRDVAHALCHHPSPWLTVREAEAYAHVRHGAVQEAIMSGDIEAYRRTESSAIVVRATEIDDWIERTWLASTCGFEGAQV